MGTDRLTQSSGAVGPSVGSYAVEDAGVGAGVAEAVEGGRARAHARPGTGVIVSERPGGAESCAEVRGVVAVAVDGQGAGAQRGAKVGVGVAPTISAQEGVVPALHHGSCVVAVV